MVSETECWTILENLSVGFFRSTPEGRILVANKALANMFGYRSSTEIVESVLDIGRELYVDKKNRDVFIETLKKKGYVKSFETMMRRRDGETFWASMDARVVSNHERDLCFEGTMLDVTKRKLLEEGLRREKTKMKNLIEHAPLGIAVIDKDRRYTYVNPSFRRIFGYDLYDIPDRNTWCEKAYPDESYRECINSQFEKDLRVLDKGEFKEKVIVVACKDGSRKTVRVYGTALGDGSYLMCYEDLTNMEEMETRYRLIFENSKVGIFQVTKDWKFIMVNPAMVKYLGYSSFEEMGHSVTDVEKQVFAHSEDKRKIDKMLERDGEVKGYEFQCLRRDGSKLWISLDAWAVYDRKGDLVYYQGICQDITESKIKEAELKSLEQQFIHAQKMEAIGTLAGGIAHDFNNVLTIILGSATALQTRLGKESTETTYVDQIISACHTAADITKDLLTFSRKQPLSLKPIEINSELMNLKKLLRRLVPENIEINIVTCKNPCNVLADRTQLRQVFFNLISNAKDAMPEGGSITIELYRVIVDDEFINRHGFGKRGEYALITFKDTGFGIEEAILPRIFEPFFTTKETGKGTGLGLATVYAIVKQHNGYITVQSKKGIGTTFYVYLPITDAEAETERNDLQYVTSLRGRGERILLVEDNGDIRRLVKEFLESSGYTVKEAKDGEEALFVLREDHFDVIITDLVMPKKSGKELYLEVRKRNKTARFILMSGYGSDLVPEVLLKDKYCDFVQKPISLDYLLKKVREVVDRGGN